jgi:hypothetical protein
MKKNSTINSILHSYDKEINKDDTVCIYEKNGTLYYHFCQKEFDITSKEEFDNFKEENEYLNFINKISNNTFQANRKKELISKTNIEKIHQYYESKQIELPKKIIKEFYNCFSFLIEEKQYTIDDFCKLSADKIINLIIFARKLDS